MNKKTLTIGLTVGLLIGTQIYVNNSQNEKIEKIEQIRQQNSNGITEQFKITHIGDGHVHGEKTVGTGEGIVYTERFFAERVGEIAVGDVVDITWNKYNYENSNWNNVENMKIIK